VVDDLALINDAIGAVWDASEASITDPHAPAPVRARRSLQVVGGTALVLGTVAGVGGAASRAGTAAGAETSTATSTGAARTTTPPAATARPATACPVGGCAQAPPTAGPRPPGCLGCGCVLPGTLVVLANGQSAPIESLRPGMSVLALDPASDLLPAGHRIVAVSHSTTTAVVGVTVRAADGREGLLEATSEHPFWVLDSGWVAASALQPGDLLLDDELGSVEVTAVQREERRSDTYNLTVEGIHTFFVEADGVRVLVHNQVVFAASDLYVGPNNQPVDLRIEAQGTRTRDFRLARDRAGLRSLIPGRTAPAGYTWHHVSFDATTGEMRMQLVRTTAHRGIRHSGGAHGFRIATKIRYDTRAAVHHAQTRGWLRGRPPPPLPAPCP
jgi:hypothetical protein